MSDSGISLSLTCCRTVAETNNKGSKVTPLKLIFISNQPLDFQKHIHTSKTETDQKKKEKLEVKKIEATPPPPQSEMQGMGRGG